jgi:uroporphyrinogen-III synthase
VRAFAAAWNDRPDCVAIGATTAAVAREAGFAPEVAATPDLEAMLRAAGLGPQS